jgi:hypothetical protein
MTIGGAAAVSGQQQRRGVPAAGEDRVPAALDLTVRAGRVHGDTL